MFLKPVAYIHTDFKEKFGIPRQACRVEALKGRIIFEPEFRNPDALRGITEFSHLWLIFDFSASHRETWSPTVRPPRLGGNQRIGVFASRSPFRPNPVGLSCVKLDGIENNTELLVSGVDLLDNTPILDIKPYLPYTDSHPEAFGSYGETFRNHHLEIQISETLLAMLGDKQEAVLACLADDPRPSYQNAPERIYHMRFAQFDIHFRVSETQLTVLAITLS